MQAFHQLYCSTKLRTFQYIFLIIIANFIIHTLDACTHPYPEKIDDNAKTAPGARPKQRPMTSKNSALREPTFRLTQGAAFIFCLFNNNKSTEILSYLKYTETGVYLLLLLKKAQIAANAKELLKESLQLVDNPLLFLFATTAKAAHRWHKLVDIRASGLDFPIAEGII